MKTELKYITVLVLISAISAGILALVHQITWEPIQAARKKLTQEAMEVVLPEEVIPSTTPLPVDPENQELKGLTFYPVTTKGGKTVGAAVQVITNSGYGGEMKVMVGLMAGENQEPATISAIKVISHQETPGLGTKATDGAEFLEQFASRDLTPDLAENIRLTKEPGGVIDGVTGATTSSKAVTEAVHRAVRGFGIQFASMAAAGEGSVR